MTLPIDAINALTARWIKELPDNTDTVCSAVGVWPLLAILADAAEGDARDQLAEATGIDPSIGTSDGLALIDWLATTKGLSGALGIWRRSDLSVREEWLARMPNGVAELFSGDARADQTALDAWARDHTDGLIEHMPIQITDDIALLLASALTLDTTWREKFKERHDASQPLRRTTEDPSIVRATDDITCVRVEGDNGIDVHLVLGRPGSPANDVLAAGLEIVNGATTARIGFDAENAPGVMIDTVDSESGTPQVSLTLPAFTVRASHDLLAYSQVFGLNAISDCSRGHTPAVSETPLCVGAAQQEAFAEFSEQGFRAAAVTAVAMMVAAAFRRTQEARRISVTYDRAFGFLATHAETGLVVFAGWVKNES